MFHFHIADDHPLFRTALNTVISEYFSGSKTTQSSDLESTLKDLEQLPDIDALMLDLHMPGSQDLFGLINVREQYPTIPVVVVSAREDINTISRAMGHGASAYIPKSTPPVLIREAIEAVTEGQTWVPENARDKMRQVKQEEVDLAAKIASLTPQQYRVLCLLKEGWLNKQIGYELGVTEATIKAHISSILKKLQVTNRTQAVIELNKLSLDATTSPE